MSEKIIKILRWSEKYTKTDMVVLAENTLWPVMGQVVASLGALVLAFAFARLASKETYGTYKFILSIPAFFSVLLIPGLDTSLRRSIARGLDGDFAVALRSRFKWSTLFLLIGFSIGVYYWVAGNTLLSIGITIVCIFTALSSIIGMYGAILAGKIMPKEGTSIYIIIRFSTIALSLITLYFFPENILLLIFATFIADVSISYFFFKKTVREQLRNKEESGEVLNYGKHLSFMTILSSFVASLDNLLVFHYLGAAQLAIYAYTTAIPDQLKGPLTGTDTLIFSKFSKHKEENIRENLLHKFLVLFVCLAAIVLTYWIGAPYIYKYLFPQYTDAVFYSQIYSISLLAISFFPASSFLSAHKKIQEQYITNISTAVVQLIIMFIFIIQWGLLGLVVSRIVTRFYNALINVYFAFKK